MTHRALLLFLPLTAFAADPLACVDPAFIDAFLEKGHGESTRFSTEVPAEAARLRLPAEFELVGSKSSESYVTVAYRAGGNTATALSSSIESLKRAGWKDPPADGGTFHGFHGSVQSSGNLLCHPSEPGPLSVEAWSYRGHALLTFSLFRHTIGDVCSGPDVASLLRLGNYLPDLKVPKGAELKDNHTEGGGDEYSAVVVLSTDLRPDALLKHFDDQIRAQGWTADAGWSGSMSVGSVWTRKDPDGPVLGTLRIAEVSSGVFNARFTVISLVQSDPYRGNPRTLADFPRP
jgi:hypothetical protein